MKFITDKIEWTKTMKEFSKEIIAKKLKRIDNSYDEAVVRLSKIGKDSLKVSISLNSFRVQEVDSDFYAALEKAASTLKAIITKYKKKYLNKHKQKQLDTYDDENVEEDITDYVTKEKIFDLEPITLKTALEEFEQTDYPFYVYKDIKDNNTITIIYRRFNNTYGIIRAK